jgi:hypothetical protein
MEKYLFVLPIELAIVPIFIGLDCTLLFNFNLQGARRWIPAGDQCLIRQERAKDLSGVQT